ncbi:MAG: glycosyltransferase family 4 protein [Myxococcota bacterium]
MRIAVVSTPFVRVPPEGYGGTELAVGVLAEGLARLGHEVTLYATGDSAAPPAQVRALYPTPVWPPNAGREMAHLLFAVQDLRTRGADVVHLHLGAGCLAAEALDLPIVYTLHHAPDAALDELYLQARPRVLFVAISRRQRTVFGGLAARTVHHGLPAGRYPLGDGGGHAAFLGRFAPEKGLHHAIDAARRADVPIRVAGRCHPPDERYFRAHVAPRVHLPGVELVGEVDHPRKVAFLGDARALLVPIEWEEPFGLVMLESMLCGTPVLAFPRGAAPELVEEGVTGWLVPDVDAMADRLARLGREPFDRARCRRQAARRFGPGRMVRGYLAAYREAMTRWRG